MRVGAVVFARMSSRRLPGKMLADIGGRPLLGRVLDRARAIVGADALVVATSTEAQDDAIAAFATAEGVSLYRGSLDDVCDRAWQCAREHSLDAIARICGDRPFFDPVEVSAQIALWRRSAAAGEQPDLISNLLPGPLAPGLTCEVVAADALARVLVESRDPADREHISRYLYAHPARFRLVPTEPRFSADSDHRFVVDTSDDLQRTRCVIAQLSDPTRAGLDEVARLTRMCLSQATADADHG